MGDDAIRSARSILPMVALSRHRASWRDVMLCSAHWYLRASRCGRCAANWRRTRMLKSKRDRCRFALPLSMETRPHHQQPAYNSQMDKE
jgi:hypothetical protein